MQTTVVNPKRLPPRGPSGQFRKRASRKTSRRRNETNENPRRGRRRAQATGYKKRRRNTAIAPASNPRRRRMRRRNPDGWSFGRIASAGLGGVGVRLIMRKIGGVRPADGKLTTTHYLAAAAGVYVAPAVAEWLGGSADEQRAAQDGAAAVAMQMLVDQHADEFASKHLMPFLSPQPTGETTGLIDGAMGSVDNPIAADEYARLSGLGQVGPSGAYVTGRDGSVWWLPGQMAGWGGGMGGMDAADMVEIPDRARVGDVIRDKASGKRFKVGTDPTDGSPMLFPMPDRSGGTAGLSMAEDAYARQVM